MSEFLRTQWPKLAIAAGIILAVLVLTQATDYGRAVLAKHGLIKAQAQASAQHTKQQATTAARYQRYQLDSTRRATENQQQLRDIHLSQQRDEALTNARPARVYLPAHPPRP